MNEYVNIIISILFIIFFIYKIFQKEKKSIIYNNNHLAIHFYIKLLICFLIILIEIIIIIIEKKILNKIEIIIECFSFIFLIIFIIYKKNYKKNFLSINLFFLYVCFDSIKNISIFILKKEIKDYKIIFYFILYLFKILIFFYNLIFKNNLKNITYDDESDENSLLSRLLSNENEEKYKIFKINVDNNDYFIVFIISINIDKIYFEIKINKKKYYFEKNFEDFLNFNKSNYDEINNNNNNNDVNLDIKKLIIEAYNLSVEINNKNINKNYYYLENKEKIFENILIELSKNNLIYLYRFFNFLNIKCSLMNKLENKYKDLKLCDNTNITNNNIPNNNISYNNKNNNK